MVPFAVAAALVVFLTPQAPADYLGDSACQSCHDTYNYKNSKHADAANARTPAATHGCESCHGAGRGHAEGGDPTQIKNPGTMPATDSSALCAACHDRTAHPQAGGTAPAADAACAGCHSVHHAAAAKLLKRRSR